jgi:hypothetical protein
MMNAGREASRNVCEVYSKLAALIDALESQALDSRASRRT